MRKNEQSEEIFTLADEISKQIQDIIRRQPPVQITEEQFYKASRRVMASVHQGISSEKSRKAFTEDAKKREALLAKKLFKGKDSICMSYEQFTEIARKVCVKKTIIPFTRVIRTEVFQYSLIYIQALSGLLAPLDEELKNELDLLKEKLITITKAKENVAQSDCGA